MIQKTDRLGRVTTYEYDHLNRLKAEKWYTSQEALDNNPNSPLRTIEYTYDEAGNLTSVTDPDATYEYDEYDGLNRQTGVTQTLAQLTPTLHFGYSYDVGSRMTEASATIGTTDDYSNTYTYNGLNQLVTLTQASQSGGQAVNPKRVDLRYDPIGLLSGITRYASTTTASPVASSGYRYDNLGRTTEIAHVGLVSGSTFAESHQYVYDAASRLSQYGNQIDGVSADYGYDPLNQLTSADDANSTFDEDYSYDANGNRVTANGDDYASGPYNRLTSDGTYTYEYDAEGNLKVRTSIATGNYSVYRWDHRNRLAGIEDFDANGTLDPEDDVVIQAVGYAYDAFNQLIVHVVVASGVQATVFSYDNGQVALQFDQSSGGDLEADDLSHRYLWGDAVDQLFADEQVNWSDNSAPDGEVLWAMTDKLGSASDAIDSNADLRVHRRFDAFGGIVEETHYNASGTAVTAGQTGYVDEAFAFTGR